MLLSLFLLFFCLSYFLKFWIYTLYFYIYVFILPFICLFIYVLIFWKSSMIVIFRHMCIWHSLDMKILLKLLKSQFRIKSIKKATAKTWVLKFVHFMQPNKWDDIKNYPRVYQTIKFIPFLLFENSILRNTWIKQNVVNAIVKNTTKI